MVGQMYSSSNTHVQYVPTCTTSTFIAHCSPCLSAGHIQSFAQILQYCLQVTHMVQPNKWGGQTCDVHCHTTVTVVQVLTHLSFKVSRKTSELGIFLQNDKDLSFAKREHLHTFTRRPHVQISINPPPPPKCVLWS